MNLKRHKTYLTRNWGLKLVSFLLALIFWFSLIPDEKTFQEKTIPVKLDILNLPSNMVIMQKPEEYVDISIRAPNRLMAQISDANVRAILDLQNARVDQNWYALKPNMVTVPLGAEVKEIYPPQVNLRLELVKEVNAAVEPNLVGQLPKGYSLVRVEVIPSTVPIKGPVSKIEDDIKVHTNPIDISNFTSSQEVEGILISPNPELRFTSETTVKVRILITPIEDEGTPSKKAASKK